LFVEQKYVFPQNLGHKKWASYSHHTATTNYPCCVPALGDSPGAGCVRLAQRKVTSTNRARPMNFNNF